MTNPWLDRRIIAFAHQGGSFEGPSSTLAAIEHALSVGATAIELDVHATSDRHIVVCHDDTVDRTTNHHGEIASLTLEEVREMDNAYWFVAGETTTPGLEAHHYLHRHRAPADRAYGVVTLAEVVERFPGVLLNLDIKRTAPEVEPYEALLADELRRLGRCDSVIVASFHDEAIKTFRRVAPEVATSAATIETTEFFLSLSSGTAIVPPAVALQVPTTFDTLTVVSRDFVDAAHDAGLAVHVWTINTESEMNELIDLGVDGIISDTPTPLARLLDERGCAWDARL